MVGVDVAGTLLFVIADMGNDGSTVLGAEKKGNIISVFVIGTNVIVYFVAKVFVHVHAGPVAEDSHFEDLITERDMGGSIAKKFENLMGGGGD